MSRSSRVILIAAMSVFAALSILTAAMSRSFVEADAATHFLYARLAIREPHLLFDVWGRPLCTALYALPATLGGVTGARLTSLAVALAAAWVTCRVAEGQRYRWPALAGIFFLAQPLVFLHSIAELTELPFALLLISAFWAYQQRRWWLLALLAALAPMARPEGFGLLALAAAGLIAARQWRWLWLLPSGLLVWTVGGWWTGDAPPEVSWWRWLAYAWPYSGASLYGSGQPWHFVKYLPAITSPALIPFALAGTWQSLRASDRPQKLLALIAVGVLIIHSLLWWRGLMASNGELRYLLVSGPMWALLAAAGWEWAFARFGWTRPHLWAGVAALVPLAANLYHPVLPLKPSAEDALARQVAQWYLGEARPQHPQISAAMPLVRLELDLLEPTGYRWEHWGSRVVAQRPAGMLLVWDPVYGPLNADQRLRVTREDIIAAGWLPLRTFTQDQVSWEAWVAPAKPEVPCFPSRP